MTAEALKVMLKLQWELCKWLLWEQCCVAVINIFNAFAETLLEVKEENNIFWEKQSDCSVQLQSHSCSEAKSTRKEKKRKLAVHPPPLPSCFVETGRIYFIQAHLQLSHKLLVCMDSSQPAKNVTNTVQTISLSVHCNHNPPAATGFELRLSLPFKYHD